MTRPVDGRAETDSALVEAARAGDVASYGRLVERYEGAAHRTAFMLGAGDDTADIVQDAFIKAYVGLGRFRADAPFRPWLLTIVANETRNRWRWLSRHLTVPLSLTGDALLQVPALSAEQVAEDHETSRSLRDAVATLPRQQRDVIVCRYLLDLSEEETSQVLGVPRGTVKSRLSRGLRALQATVGIRGEPGTQDRERSGA